MKITSYVLLAWLSSVAIVHAEEVSVRYDKGTYFLTAEFYVEASPARVMEVLTDYENITDLNSTINVSELLEFPDNSMIRIRTVMHDCILFFCKDITRVEDVLQVGNEKLEAFLIPMLSDLRSGYAVWILAQHSLGTTVQYAANMQFKFWVPPIIRSHLLTRKFKQRVLESVERLQAIAKT